MYTAIAVVVVVVVVVECRGPPPQRNASMHLNTHARMPRELRNTCALYAILCKAVHFIHMHRARECVRACMRAPVGGRLPGRTHTRTHSLSGDILCGPAGADGPDGLRVTARAGYLQSRACADFVASTFCWVFRLLGWQCTCCALPEWAIIHWYDAAPKLHALTTDRTKNGRQHTQKNVYRLPGRASRWV